MKFVSWLILLVCSVLIGGLASAQDPRRADNYVFKEVRTKSTKQNYDVTTRPRPEYDPYGKAAGAFRLFPTVDVTTGYNDNIRAAEGNGRLEDLFVNIEPALRVESQFNRHELNFFTGGTLLHYSQEDDEDQTSFYTGADTRIDISNDLNLVGGIGYRQADEARTIINAQAGGVSENPIRFDVFDVNIGANKRFNRLEIFAGIFRRDIDYEDGRDANGAIVDQDLRDIVIKGANSRIDYNIAPDYSVFAKTEWSDREYDQQTATDFDSTGQRSGLGFKFAVTNQVTGEVFAGYMSREYENRGDASDFYFGGSLDWYPTPLVTVNAAADRDIQDAIFGNASFKTVTDFSLGAAYELRRNIIISPKTTYSFEDYEEISGDVQIFSIGNDIEYLVNRKFSVVGGYRYFNRAGNGVLLTPLDFQQNLITLSAKFKL